jgi:Mg2+/Co2+ transporter CorB
MFESLLIFLFSIILAVGISAFFSAAETAITSVPRERIHRLKLEGVRRARLVSNLRQEKEGLIGALLLGNNALNTLASALATSAAIQLFGPDGVVYATLAMTIILVIFAEILPKTLALEHPDRIALALAPLIYVFVTLFKPITMGLRYIVRGLMWCLRLHPSSHTNQQLMSATEALRGAIDLHHEEGTVVKNDKDMLGSILDLSERTVEEIMIHRKQLVTLSANHSAASIIRHMLDSPHSRVPLWKDNPDNIIGVLHIKDVLALLRSQQQAVTMDDILRISTAPWFIPTSTSLSDQLQAFRLKRNHLALVIDEYGALMGVVTLEDILEEIVGHIDDEHDAITDGIFQEQPGTYRIRGDVTLRDINRQLDWQLPDDNAHTLAGLIMYASQSIPTQGSILELYGMECTVLHRHHNQLLSLRLRPFSTKEQEEF